MADTIEDFLQSRPPTPERPLLGQTVLVVEDSRFASDAVRLLCLRSGARIRRADSLRAAARHLCTYHPSILIVDLGLPDGSGLELIEALDARSPRVPVIIATSGDDMLEATARAAGADAFLTKPLVNIAQFQETILSLLPRDLRPKGLRTLPTEDVDPDRIAYRDDLAHIADLLSDVESPRIFDYASRFLHGVAKTADDTALMSAVRDLDRRRAEGEATTAAIARVVGLIEDRLRRERVV
ncbi:MAG: response regulator [Paracoccaceae bacterium]|nr:response regulator [Paracoccaceae bacterium]